MSQGACLDLQALLADAAKLGLSPLAFWEMTPREVLLAMDAAAWQAEQEQRRALSLAWHVAALQRARRLPSLRQLLRPPSRASRAPIAERREEFAALRAKVQAWKEGNN